MNDNTRNEHLEQLNQETGKLAWKELERHFARGVVIKVNNKLDLVQVAATFAQDNKQQVQAWLDAELVEKAGTDDATRWNTHNTLFWAIVTAPWVLVQEIVEQ